METKQVIVIRKDLNMRKGKMVAQGAHASTAVCIQQERTRVTIEGYPDESPYWKWINGLQTKVCVGVSSEQELQSIYDAAKSAGLPCSLIVDSGKTEFNGKPTKTAVAVGPAKSEEIDLITGELTLL